MSNLREYAEHEMKHWIESDDELSHKMAKDVLEIVDVFSKQGHSGFTANVAIDTLKRVLRFKPLNPLTGEDDEWEEVDGQPGHYQNKRYSAVFKGEDGRAYDINAFIFSDDGGETWFRDRNSREYITFPYEVPDRPEKVFLDHPHRGWVIRNKDLSKGAHLND